MDPRAGTTQTPGWIQGPVYSVRRPPQSRGGCVCGCVCIHPCVWRLCVQRVDVYIYSSSPPQQPCSLPISLSPPLSYAFPPPNRPPTTHPPRVSPRLCRMLMAQAPIRLLRGVAWPQIETWLGHDRGRVLEQPECSVSVSAETGLLTTACIHCSTWERHAAQLSHSQST